MKNPCVPPVDEKKTQTNVYIFNSSSSKNLMLRNKSIKTVSGHERIGHVNTK
jgi:hypothetical protein